MKTKTVVIIGSGHLAYRVKGLVVAKAYAVIHITNALTQIEHQHLSTINAVAKALRSIDFSCVAMTYILNEEDEHNLELVIALMALHPDLPMTTSLFNEAISPHLQAAHPQLSILNPARIAAPLFIEALDQPIHRKANHPTINPLRSLQDRDPIHLLQS